MQKDLEMPNLYYLRAEMWFMKVFYMHNLQGVISAMHIQNYISDTELYKWHINSIFRHEWPLAVFGEIAFWEVAVTEAHKNTK